MKYFGFYGTLRKGHYNYERCMTKMGKLLEGVEYIVTHRLVDIPFKMLNLGGYPMVMETSKNSDITIDIFSIDNEEVARRIERMETGAGYKEINFPVKLEDGTVITCYMWVGDKTAEKYYGNAPVITSGDWNSKNSEKSKHELV